MDKEQQEIQEFIRKGTSVLEQWKFILSSLLYRKYWEETQKGGKLQLCRWELILQQIKKLESAEETLQNEGVQKLGDLLPEAQEAVPFLITLFSSATLDLRLKIVLLFKKIGTPAREASCVLLEAFWELKNLQTSQWKLFHSPSFFVGLIEALGALKLVEAVPLLIETLKSHFHLRGNVLIALGNIGSAAKEAIPYLLDILHDPQSRLGVNVAWALTQIAPEHHKATERLLHLLKSNNHQQRQQAMELLSQKGKNSTHNVLLLAQALKESESTVKSRVACSLGNIGSPASIALPHLQEALRDKDKVVRFRAAIAINQIRPNSYGSLTVLTQLLSDKNPYLRREVIQSLGELGATAQGAVPFLQKLLLKDSTPDISAEIQLALQKILAPLACLSSPPYPH
jgi:HEAT repeat protein